jgi:hypothetical protein
MSISEIRQTVMPESTIRYLKENEHAFSLPRQSDKCFTQPRALRRPTIGNILKDRLVQVTVGVLRYFYAVSREFGHIQKLSALKSIKRGKRALVLGNGPSLGYLNEERFRKFQESGGEVFSVNNWSSTHLSSVTPDYLVISDGASLVDPDSSIGELLSDDVKEKQALLKAFLNEHKQVKIACPLVRVKELAKQFGKERIMGFVDHEMRAISSNIDPRFPRGYVSLTLFKALAIAIYMGYEEICLLGMDNTFPRDTFCDSNNTIYRLERHAGGKDSIFDQSAYYPSMDVWAQDLLDLFADLHRCFNGHQIINLDPFSLTDVFRKIDDLGSFDSALGIGEKFPTESVHMKTHTASRINVGV